MMTVAFGGALLLTPKEKQSVVVEVRPPSRATRVFALGLGGTLTLLGGVLLIGSTTNLITAWHDIAFSNRFGGAFGAIVFAAQITLLGLSFIVAGMQHSSIPKPITENPTENDEPENEDDYGPLK